MRAVALFLNPILLSIIPSCLDPHLPAPVAAAAPPSHTPPPQPSLPRTAKTNFNIEDYLADIMQHGAAASAQLAGAAMAGARPPHLAATAPRPASLMELQQQRLRAGMPAGMPAGSGSSGSPRAAPGSGGSKRRAPRSGAGGGGEEEGGILYSPRLEAPVKGLRGKRKKCEAPGGCVAAQWGLWGGLLRGARQMPCHVLCACFHRGACMPATKLCLPTHASHALPLAPTHPTHSLPASMEDGDWTSEEVDALEADQDCYHPHAHPFAAAAAQRLPPAQLHLLGERSVSSPMRMQGSAEVAAASAAAAVAAATAEANRRALQRQCRLSHASTDGGAVGRVVSEPSMVPAQAGDALLRHSSEPALGGSSAGWARDADGGVVAAQLPPAKLQRLDSGESAALEALAGLGTRPCSAGAARSASPGGGTPAVQHSSGHGHRVLPGSGPRPLYMPGATTRQPRDAFGRFQPKRSHTPGAPVITVEPPFSASRSGSGSGSARSPNHWAPGGGAAQARPPPATTYVQHQMRWQQQQSLARHKQEQQVVLQQELLARLMAAQSCHDTGAKSAVLEAALALAAVDGMTPAIAAVLQYIARDGSMPPAERDEEGAAGGSGRASSELAAGARSQDNDEEQRQDGGAGSGGSARDASPSDQGTGTPDVMAAKHELFEEGGPGAAAQQACPIGRWGSGSQDEAAALAAVAAAAVAASGAVESVPGMPQLHLLPAQLVHLPSDAEGSQQQLQQFLRTSVVPAAAEAAAKMFAAQLVGSQALVVVAPVIVPYSLPSVEQQQELQA